MITAASGLGETSRGFGATLGFCPTPFELPYGFSLLFSTARASLTPPRGAEGGAELGGWGGAELGWPGLKLGVAVVPEPVLPALTWQMWSEGEGADQVAHINATLDLTKGWTTRPKSVHLRHATTDPNSGRLDFRWFNLDENCALPKVDGKVCPTMMVWFSEEMTPVQQTGSQWVYTVSLKAPAKGWGGFFVELRFPGISELFFELPYTVTTQTVVTPTKLPFPDCHGAECEGKLV